MIILWIIVPLFLLLFYHWYRDRKRALNFFKDRGIPGPDPNFFLGNFIDAQNGLSAAIQRWGKQYGSTFGYFEGPIPVLVTSDVEILRRIFIKDFTKFAARKRFAVQADPNDERRVHLFFSYGNRWKRQRSVMNKAFTARRLKLMTPTIHSSVRNMMDILEKRAREEYFDIYPILQCLTLEIIMSVGFGVDFDAQREKENIFLRKCRSVFTDNMPTSGKRPLFMILVALGIVFPSLGSLLYKLQVFFHENNIDPDSTLWFMDAAGELINQRRQNKKCQFDFIQLMLDVEVDSDSDSSNGSETDDDTLTMTIDPNDKTEYSNISFKNDLCPLKKFLTFEEMKANCQLFLLAGYETTSTGLAYIIYELSLNQDLQEQVYQEIITNIPKDDLPTYHTLKKLKLLDMFVFETFRLHPIAPFVIGRTCLEEVEINGLTIPKGLGVMTNVFDLQYDSQCWPDPEQFNPERFRKDLKHARDSMYYLPFGAGPRNCIGLRFALHEIRIAVSTLVRKYNILPCEKTEVPLETAELATIVPKHGIPVKLQLR